MSLLTTMPPPRQVVQRGDAEVVAVIVVVASRPMRRSMPRSRRVLPLAEVGHTSITGRVTPWGAEIRSCSPPILMQQPAELRFTNTGTPVTNLRVAVTQRLQQDGEWRDGETSFFKVNVWRGQAEHLADSLAKGDRVMVTGRLRQRTWETPEGEKRSVAEIEADEVGASLKFATAKVERASERSPSDHSQDRERQAERGGDFNDQPPF
jgi:single-strand DNA-binding protein